MKFHVPAILLSSFVIATAQSIENGSFESDNNASNGNHNYYSGLGASAEISATSNPGSYLPAWKITRDDFWIAGSQTRRVDVYNGNADLGNPYVTHKGTPVKNGPFTGQTPFYAQKGDLALGFYHESAPASLSTSTSAENTILGLTAGQSYRVDYWYSAFGITSADTTAKYDIDLKVDVDGSQRALHDALAYIGSPTSTGGSTGIWQTNTGTESTVYTAWKQGSATFQATSATAALKFIGLLQGGPALLQLDNVSVTQVPEPSTMLVAALGAAGFLLRRRR